MNRIRLALSLFVSAVLVGCSSVKTADRPGDRRQPPPGVGVRPQKNNQRGQVQTLPAVQPQAAVSPVKQAQDYYDAKDYRRAVAIVNITVDKPELTQKERETLWMTRLRALEAMNDINTLAVTKMSEAEISMVAKEAQLPSFRAVAYSKLGESRLLERKQEEAREYFQRVVQEGQYDPKATAEFTTRAQDYLNSIDSMKKVEPKTIGVVLPLTGKYASVAQRTLRGIQLGLGLNGKPNSSFRLAVIDTEGNPDLARKGVERLVQEDNVIAIIGGLLSRTASAEASTASELGVPTLTLSLKSGVTELGNNVFRNSLTTEMQIRHLVRVSMEEMGYKRFAILYPNDGYGVEAANLFWDEVNARGGQVSSAQVYSPKETDYRDVVRRLVGTFYSDARADEYRNRAKEIAEKEKDQKKSVRKNEAENVLSPVTDFDAIFVPDGLKALGLITASLAFNDVRNMKLLGTNLWNTQGVGKRAGHFSNNLLFVDSFAATDSRFQSAPFVKEYKTIFNDDPGLFEVQGYDSALMLRQLISQGASSRQSLSEALNHLQNLPGLLAPLSVSDDREILRPVVALTVDNAQIVPWKPTQSP